MTRNFLEFVDIHQAENQREGRVSAKSGRRERTRVWVFIESLGQPGGGFWRGEGLGEVEDIGKDFLS